MPGRRDLIHSKKTHLFRLTYTDSLGRKEFFSRQGDALAQNPFFLFRGPLHGQRKKFVEVSEEKSHPSNQSKNLAHSAGKVTLGKPKPDLRTGHHRPNS